MDRTPPITLDNIPSSWNQKSSFIVQLTAHDYADTIHDTPSGVYKTYYTTDGTDPTITSPCNTNTNPLLDLVTNITITGQNAFIIKFFSVDYNGNIEPFKTKILKLDNVSPQSSSSTNFPIDGTDGWYKTNPTITLSAIDTVSGVLSISYRWDNDDFGIYSSPFQIQSKGVHTLQYYSMDVAGNVENIHTETYKFDNQSPTTQDDAPTGLQKQPVTVHFFTSDDASGVRTTYYTTDGSPPTTSSSNGSSVILSTTGNYTLKYFSIDFAGNSESVKQSLVDVFIDTEAPHAYIYEDIAINGTNGWYITTPQIYLSASDPSGIKEIKYKRFPVGATTTAKYTGTVDLSAAIDLSLNYNIKLDVDQSGFPIQIDLRGNIPGQTTIVEIINKINAAVGQTIATQTDAQGETGTGYITLTSPTAGTEKEYSEIKFLQPTSHDSTNEVFGLSESSYPHTYTELVVFKTYVSPFTLLWSDHWQVDYYAIDNEDNQGETSSKLYKLDTQVPITIPVASYLPDGESGWYKTLPPNPGPDITFSFSDNLSGIYKTFYQWNNGIISEYIEGSTVIHIPQQGINTLKYYSIDLAGNIESQKQTDFKLDYTNPITTDNTLELQGIIFTAHSDDIEEVIGEIPTYLGTGSTLNVVYSILQTAQKNVKVVFRLYNATQEYYSFDISGIDKNEIYCLPVIRNENSARLADFQIKLNAVVVGNILRNFNDVFRIYNKTKNVVYSIDDLSILSSGILNLSGEKPISIGDILEVDYAYNGPAIPPSNFAEIDYQYSTSLEVDVLNTLDYTILVNANSPKIHDHNVTVILYPTDNASGATETYYTIDGTDPKTSTTTQLYVDGIYLTEDGTYTIKYYSKDAAGNIEDTKTALYPIIIDKKIPILNLAFLPDPLETGENGWYNKSFRLKTDTSSNCVKTRYNENALDVTGIRIQTSVDDNLDFEETIGIPLNITVPSIEITSFNNNIDFEETSGIQLTATVPLGFYTPANLASILQTQLNSVGSSTYTITFSAKKYTISSNLAGGANKFNLLWNSGTNVNISLISILGFDRIDKYSLDTYISDNEVRTSIVYTPINLASELQTLLNSAGSSNYSVSIIDIALIGYHFNFVSDLSGGIFNLLWSTGPFSSQTIGKTLGFDVTLDNVGLAFYTSNYFKIKIQHFFIKEVDLIQNSITQENLTVIGIEKGESGFYDEIIVSGNMPLTGQELNVDYKHYVGIDKVDFALDSLTLTTSINVYNDLDKFVGIYSDAVHFEIIFNATPGQFYLLDGQHIIYAKSYDHNSIVDTGIVQKVSNLYIVPFKLDRITPVTTDDVQPIGWRQNEAVITLTPTDTIPGSGIAATHYTIDGSNPTSLSAKIQDLPDQKIVINVSGIYTIKYFSIDIAGNSEQIKIAIDPNIAGQISVNGSGQTGTTLNTIGYNAITATIKKWTRFTIEGIPSVIFTVVSDSTINAHQSTLTFSPALPFSPTDAAKVILETSVYVDASVPETTLSTSYPPDGQHGWFVTDPEVSLTAFDLHSGIYKTYYKLPSDISFHEYTIPFNLLIEGDISVEFFSIDNVGNQEQTKSVSVKFDQTPPITTTNIPNVGYTNNPTVIFTINDPYSGGYITHFTIDGSDPDLTSPTGSQVTFQSSGIYTLKFFSIDNAGNVEVFQTKILYLDLEIPLVTDFNPPDGIVSESTTVISFHLKDALSGVDISSTIFEVDGIEYSNQKNTAYFHYSGTSADYFVEIYPIQNVLNFEDIQTLILRNVKDFAGNSATVLEFNFTPEDSTPPRIRELNPIPFATDVSPNSNVVAFISDEQSGVDLQSIKVKVNELTYSIILNEVLKIQYIGPAETAKIYINNNVLRTIVNGQQDLVLSFIDSNYNTIKKVNDYIDNLIDYSCSIIDTRFEQSLSKYLINISNVDLTVDPILKISIPENNLNFTFIERETGYLVFVTPLVHFSNNTQVNVIVSASDNSNNVMTPFSYYFTPNIIALLSVKKRNYLNKTALTFIDDIHSNIADNYTRSRSTNFYGHHKSIGKELSRVQEDLDHLQEDLFFPTIRDPFLYEKLGYLLDMLPSAGLSHSEYRNLLLSLLAIYFQGSTKKSLEQGVSLFTGSSVQIQEVVFTEGSDISEQFIFTADIILADNRLLGLNLELLNEQLDLIFNLVKPAHVFTLKRFIFSDKFAFQAGCTLQWLMDQYGNYVFDQYGHKIPIVGPSGFQVATKNAATAICDRVKYDFEIDYTEDTRTDCKEIQTAIQTIEEDVSVQFTGTEDFFFTFHKPLLKNIDPPEVAIISDILVTINSIPATIISIDPLTGYIQLGSIPGELDTVIVTYFYNSTFIYRPITFYLNDFQTLGNDFDTNFGSLLKGGSDLSLTHEVLDVEGGFNIDTRLHAHICETSVHFEFDNHFIPGDIYKIPECNDSKFFYLNDYSIIGSDFNSEHGSYLNDLYTINRASKCPYLFIELENSLEESIELPQESSSFEITTSLSETVEEVTEQISSEFDWTLSENVHRTIFSKDFILNDPVSTLNSRNDQIAPSHDDDGNFSSVEHLHSFEFNFGESFQAEGHEVTETSVSGYFEYDGFVISSAQTDPLMLPYDPYANPGILNNTAYLLNEITTTPIVF